MASQTTLQSGGGGLSDAINTLPHVFARLLHRKPNVQVHRVGISWYSSVQPTCIVCISPTKYFRIAFLPRSALKLCRLQSNGDRSALPLPTLQLEA